MTKLSIREFAADTCMCGGPGERKLVGGLSLYVCQRCGKATRERPLRIYHEHLQRAEVEK